MAEKITKDMTFGELVQQYPDVAPILAGYGLHCIGCMIGAFETIEEGSRAHNLTDEQLDKMLEELNNSVK